MTNSATQLVLKAHKEAVNSLSGSGSTKLGTVATVVAAANATSLEASKEIEAAMRVSLRNALGTMLNKSPDGQMDDLTIMKETMRVKDEELQNLARELRARDSTIREIAEKLSDTADAAEAAASAAHIMDDQRRLVCAEMEQLKEASNKQLESAMFKLKESEGKLAALSRENEELTKQRDLAHQEAHLWRSELAKARECMLVLEATVVRADEKVRIAESDAEAKIKEAAQKESAAVKEKQELLAYVSALQAELKRQKINANPIFEKTESCSDISDTCSLTKHVDSGDDNVDKACLSVSSREVPVAEQGVVNVSEVDQATTDIRSVGSDQWNDIQATEASISDVREVERSSLDIPVVIPPVGSQNNQDPNTSHQP